MALIRWRVMDRHGKAAGPIRNLQMLNTGKPDVVIFFHDHIAQSKGTLHMVNAARQANVPVYHWKQWLEEAR